MSKQYNLASWRNQVTAEELEVKFTYQNKEFFSLPVCSSTRLVKKPHRSKTNCESQKPAESDNQPEHGHLQKRPVNTLDTYISPIRQ